MCHDKRVVVLVGPAATASNTATASSPALHVFPPRHLASKIDLHIVCSWAVVGGGTTMSITPAASRSTFWTTCMSSGTYAKTRLDNRVSPVRYSTERRRFVLVFKSHSQAMNRRTTSSHVIRTASSWTLTLVADLRTAVSHPLPGPLPEIVIARRCRRFSPSSLASSATASRCSASTT